MKTSEQIGELAGALAKAQAELKPVKKESENPFYKSKYADLASIIEKCIPILAKHGIAVIHAPSTTPDMVVTVEMRLAHTGSGQFVEAALSAKPAKSDAQGIGSTITYLRRYLLQSMICSASADDVDEGDDSDDDGHAASHNIEQKPKRDPFTVKTRPKVAPGDYVVSFGEFAGRAIKTLTNDELEGIARQIHAKAQKQGTSVTGIAKEFLDAAEAHFARN